MDIYLRSKEITQNLEIIDSIESVPFNAPH